MMRFRARVLPGPKLMVAEASSTFGPDGRLKDGRYVKALAKLMAVAAGISGSSGLIKRPRHPAKQHEGPRSAGFGQFGQVLVAGVLFKSL